MKLFLGSIHARPSLQPINLKLIAWGSKWRITVSKSIGLHIWNPKTHECRCVDRDGYITVPDLPNDNP